MPSMKKDGLPEKAREINAALLTAGINAKYDDKGAIGKRYAKHDEIGTPYCVTIDYDSLTDGQVTIRDRDTTDQVRIPIAEAVEQVRRRIEG
jgi:glycyl-tRNA synthetase